MDPGGQEKSVDPIQGSVVTILWLIFSHILNGIISQAWYYFHYFFNVFLKESHPQGSEAVRGAQLIVATSPMHIRSFNMRHVTVLCLWCLQHSSRLLITLVANSIDTSLCSAIHSNNLSAHRWALCALSDAKSKPLSGRTDKTAFLYLQIIWNIIIIQFIC